MDRPVTSYQNAYQKRISTVMISWTIKISKDGMIIPFFINIFAFSIITPLKFVVKLNILLLGYKLPLLLALSKNVSYNNQRK